MNLRISSSSLFNLRGATRTGALALTAMLAVASSTAASLAERVADYRKEHPKAFTRDMARDLSVSEAEVLGLEVGTTAVRLRDGADTPRAIIAREFELGEVTAITRNEEVVLEVTGKANAPRAIPPTPTKDGAPAAKSDSESRPFAGFLTGPIDLRPSLKEWQFAFAVTAPGKEGKVRRSFQFFDTTGKAVHKIYVNDAAGAATFDQLVTALRTTDQAAPITTKPAAVPAVAKPDSAINQTAFVAEWDTMTDVHQFAGVLREFGVTREQALRLAGETRAKRVELSSLRTFLDNAAKTGVPILAFVGNEGMTQIYTGPIEKTAASGKWYNVLDPKFNLHIDEPKLTSIWLVKKPSSNGLLTAVEIFNAQGEIVLQFYSKRERGQPESEAWHQLLATLEPLKS